MAESTWKDIDMEVVAMVSLPSVNQTSISLEVGLSFRPGWPETTNRESLDFS